MNRDDTTPSPTSSASRRRFLQLGGFTVLGLAVAACSGGGEDDTGLGPLQIGIAAA